MLESRALEIRRIGLAIVVLAAELIGIVIAGYFNVVKWDTEVPKQVDTSLKNRCVTTGPKSLNLNLGTMTL